MILVSNYQEAFSNAKIFNLELKSSDYFQEKLSQFRHWYFFPEADFFAPSKFIGYKDNSEQKYTMFLYQGADGRETDVVLRKFFKAIDKDQIPDLYHQLELFLWLYDKKPNKKAVIHIRK